ncbi:MAG TPA: YezD family protein [Novosphingobium sp.]|nr:YezD family protein [Novosphingobium sp.]
MNQQEKNAAIPAAALDALGHLEESLASVRAALQDLRYGSVALTVHEGRVVQIDITEKKRFRPN